MIVIIIIIIWKSGIIIIIIIIPLIKQGTRGSKPLAFDTIALSTK